MTLSRKLAISPTASGPDIRLWTLISCAHVGGLHTRGAAKGAQPPARRRPPRRVLRRPPAGVLALGRPQYLEECGQARLLAASADFFRRALHHDHCILQERLKLFFIRDALCRGHVATRRAAIASAIFQ